MSEATPQPDGTPEISSGRRRFCQFAIGGMAAASVGTVGYPVVAFLSLPKSLTQEEAIEVPLADLREGAAVWGERMGQQVVIIKTADGALAFNGACTHLGCVVQWDGTTRTFKCPCHGASFNEQGEPVSGPVNIPLRRVAFEIKDGVLRIV